MTSEREGRLRRRAEGYTAAWCSQNPARVAGFYSPDGSLRVNADPPAVGRDAITAVAQGFMSDFPDMQVIMDDLVINGDQTVYHWTLIGTNTGPGGAGKTGYEECRIGPDGLIAESRGHFDTAEYERQLERGVTESR
jgi:predicted ester cyclase